MSEIAHEWIEVVVPAKVALADGLASELVRHVEAAKGGVQVRKGDVVFWVHPSDLESALSQVRACLLRLSGEGWLVDAQGAQAGNFAPEQDWRDAWKKYFHITRLTRQVVVVPSWEQYQPTPGDIPIHLDPGQAFGTGAHASTQLVLQEMQDLLDSALIQAPPEVLDLGTGSGILAIAAAKFWPRSRITATDIAPMSIRATRENAQNNQVAEQITASTASLSDLDLQFPLVLANLQAHILRDLRDSLLARMAPNGMLIISGILSSQIHPTVEFYCETEVLKLQRICESDLNTEWSCARLQRLS